MVDLHDATGERPATADTYAGGELLAEVTRSGFVEGYHRGSVVVLSATGEAVAAAGDVTAPVFPRSSNKPFQATGMLRAGLAPAEPAQLALAAASHHGEPMHIDLARSMLRGAGLTEEALACPPDLPLSESARRDVLLAGGDRERIYMNCSGKHTGMLLTCVAAGWPTEGYHRPDHPLQKHLRSVLEEVVGESVAAVGVDGCGAPVLAISLYALASGFLRVVRAEPGTGERAVADAMRQYPELVSGTGADDARLMRGIPGILAKGGAEGVLAVAVPGVGAVAMKIDDGNRRARYPVLASALRRLGVDAPVLAELAADADGVVQRGRGEPVGTVRAIW
ncbi:asparaginase [Rugosimonospora africana]|uniref:Asparaginase n=1 Tax=Rugosimonospora africana TaxID=556532 RepID=A0A8J3VMI4_9ACTN|nr:asparaginase [Rugosimonospora africana]GIH12339.1 asparaginase [Rugosimonospora africana]